MEITLDILQKVIKKRKPNSHKGNFGRVLLIGGNINYGGAIIMGSLSKRTDAKILIIIFKLLDESLIVFLF